MAESSQEKTEHATPKRKRDARKKGQVARSRELSTGLVVGASLMGVMAGGHSLAGKGLAMMRQSLTLEPGLIGDPEAQIALLFHRLFEALVAIAPIMVAGLIAAVVGPALLGGWNFSSQAFSPQFSRINPMSGLARMFSSNALVELGKSLLKFSVLGAIGALYVWKHREPLMALSSLDLATSIREALGLALWALVWMSAALLLVAFVDAPYQWWKHQKELRMTKQEVREEMKESDGKPEVKSAHPPIAAPDGEPPHDGQGADRRRGHHQSDALRRRDSLLGGQDARTGRGSEGQRCDRRCDSRACDAEQGAAGFSSAASACAVSQCGARSRNSGRSVSGGGDGADVSLPAAQRNAAQQARFRGAGSGR